MTVNIYDMAQTWNNGATTFAGIKLNVTDTASASGSLLMDLQVGGASLVWATKDGELSSTGCSVEGATGFRLFSAGRAQQWAFIGNGVWTIKSSGYISWSNSTTSTATADVRLYRDAANTLAQYNGANAQAFNIYNTRTDASNYERGFMRWSGNALKIGVEAAGTGSTRVVHISNLPTSNPGAGILWNNAGTPAIGT